MRKMIGIVIFVFVFISTSFAHENNILKNFEGPVNFNDKKYIFKDNQIEIFEKNHDYEHIIITSDYQLIVNGEKISTNNHTKKLLKKYYYEVFAIRDQAIKIGLEGAKVGLSGAKIGLTAVVSLPLLIFGGADEFEERMEKAGEKLEKQAEILEKKADILEDQADNLEDLEDDLKDRVAELDDLNWF